MRALAHHGVGQDGAVVDARAGADFGAAAQNDVASDLGVGLDGHAGLDHDLGRGAKGGVLHVLGYDAASEDLFRRDQLFAVVDPRHFLGRDIDRIHADGGRCLRHDVGQVVLGLGVARGKLGRGFAQKLRRGGVNAGVDLGDTALGIACVLVLDHPDNFPRVVAHDAPVARGIAHHRSQHGQPAALLGLRDQRGQGFRAQERHVAVQDHHQPVEIGQRC